MYICTHILHIYMNTYVHRKRETLKKRECLICIYIHKHNIYIYIEREREREKKREKGRGIEKERGRRIYISASFYLDR